LRVRVFVDFWNFQLAWNAHMRPQNCDWRALPGALLAEARLIMEPMGVTEQLTIEETHVYASVDAKEGGSLRGWLLGTLDRFPSYSVKVRERRPRQKTIHCRHCRAEFSKCASCGEQYMPSAEKGVDAAIVTDLLALAHQRAYDLAILVSSDADFVPAVEHLQSTGGVRVINAGWAGQGHELKRTCWASFDLNRVAPKVCRD